MDGPRQDPFASLRANTLIWIAVVIWLVWGYLGQTPPGGPYTEGLRAACVAILVVIVPLVSLIIIAAWVVALRERRQGQPLGECPGQSFGRFVWWSVPRW